MIIISMDVHINIYNLQMLFKLYLLSFKYFMLLDFYKTYIVISAFPHFSIKFLGKNQFEEIFKFSLNEFYTI